jgi:hypothetical protein
MTAEEVRALGAATTFPAKIRRFRPHSSGLPLRQEQPRFVA